MACATREQRVMARVAKEIDLIAGVSEPVLILNSSCLDNIPNLVLCDEHCIRHLQELCLKNNLITSLPREISKLRCLRKLYIPTNILEHLPEALADLPSLTFLDVSNNSIASISPSVARMKSLEDLNVGNNRLTYLPDELWRVPHLHCLNAQGNQLTAISSEIVHCQSLSKLILDCNDLSFLPTQVTKLRKLKYLSLAGNKLQALPNDFSECILQTLLVDMNVDLSCIPVSLASLSWWGALGIEGCPVHVTKENLSFLKPLRTCGPIPSLTELTARFLHGILRISLKGSVVLWLPEKLCSILHLPLGLRSWLVPSGRCTQGSSNCRSVYFEHHYSMLVSGMFYKKIRRGGVCKPDDIALSIDCCSSQCAKSFFSVF